jgi:serine/threonine-protein kinase RsbW
VHLSVTKAPDRLIVVIADEGEGFDLNNLPNPLAEENLLRQSGRGLLLIQAFVDEFQVRRAQPGGTEVRMVKYLAKAS